MPIEVRELVIRASVVNENKQQGDPTGKSEDAKLLKLQSKIVQECMDQIKEAIESQNRR